MLEFLHTCILAYLNNQILEYLTWDFIGSIIFVNFFILFLVVGTKIVQPETLLEKKTRPNALMAAIYRHFDIMSRAEHD